MHKSKVRKSKVRKSKVIKRKFGKSFKKKIGLGVLGAGALAATGYYLYRKSNNKRTPPQMNTSSYDEEKYAKEIERLKKETESLKEAAARSREDEITRLTEEITRSREEKKERLQKELAAKLKEEEIITSREEIAAKLKEEESKRSREENQKRVEKAQTNEFKRTYHELLEICKNVEKLSWYIYMKNNIYYRECINSIREYTHDIMGQSDIIFEIVSLCKINGVSINDPEIFEIFGKTDNKSKMIDDFNTFKSNLNEVLMILSGVVTKLYYPSDFTAENFGEDIFNTINEHFENCKDCEVLEEYKNEEEDKNKEDKKESYDIHLNFLKNNDDDIYNKLLKVLNNNIENIKNINQEDKKLYKQLAFVLHPDKTSNKSVEIQNICAELFKLIGINYYGKKPPRSFGKSRKSRKKTRKSRKKTRKSRKKSRKVKWV